MWSKYFKEFDVLAQRTVGLHGWKQRIPKIWLAWWFRVPYPYWQTPKWMGNLGDDIQEERHALQSKWL
jgi:hypothetical protein